MKKLILGIAVFTTGMLGAAIITTGVAANAVQTGAACSYVELLLQYDLSPVITAYLCLAIVGFILALVGLHENEREQNYGMDYTEPDALDAEPITLYGSQG